MGLSLVEDLLKIVASYILHHAVVEMDRLGRYQMTESLVEYLMEAVEQVLEDHWC